MKGLLRASVVLVAMLGLAACQLGNPPLTDAEREQFRLEQEARRFAAGEAAVAQCAASQCATLNIGALDLADYSILNTMPHITELMASSTNLANLEDISGMSQLVGLHITNSDVTDLTGLRHFPNLKVLHVESLGTEVDKSPIAQLTGLRELAVGNFGPESDASFVQTMRSLEKLKIRWSEGDADLSVLRDHPSLRMVDIGGDLPDDQGAVLTMPNLESIMFHDDRNLQPDIRDDLTGRLILRVDVVMPVC